MPLGGPRQRAVLVLLLLEANTTVAVDRLVDRLWHGDPPASSTVTLQGYVSRLRRALVGLPVHIATSAVGYGLYVDVDAIDTCRFDRLVGEGQAALAAGRPEEAAAALRTALELWRGPALADVAYEGFAAGEVGRLDELRLEALEQRIEADLILGHGGLTAELEGLVARHPLREGFRGQLMRALHASGRRAEALRTYRTGRERLAEELGIEPGLALQRLEYAILMQDPALEVARPVAPARTRTVVPAQLTSFVGRQREVGVVVGLLERFRLVTLTGPGGTGKTRLAYQAATVVSAGGAVALAVAELAAETDADLVPRAVLDALGLRTEADIAPLAAVVDAIGDSQFLVVLDNCEQVLDGAGRLASELLSSCPRLSILTTSREPLDVDGEAVWLVPALPLPDASTTSTAQAMSSDAVRLFVERAATSAPAWRLSAEDVPHVVSICRRLDGMPLALELAATRLRAMSAPEIASRLDRRFTLLTGGRRSALPHHRTLLAAVEWSHDSLDEQERALFRRLAVFPADFTLEAAEVVCAGDDLAAGSVVEVLVALVNRSMLARVEAGGGVTSYRLLETMRAFALERLADAGEESVLAASHATATVARAEAAARRFEGPDRRAALEQIDAGEDDVRAALEWLIGEGRAGPALRLVGACWRWWEHRSLVEEGRSWIGRALAMPALEDGSTLAALVGAAYLAYLQGDMASAIRSCDAGLRLAHHLGSLSCRAHFLSTLSEVDRYQGRHQSAEVRAREAVAIFAGQGDPWWEAHALRVVVLLAWDRGMLDEAASMAETCLELSTRCGDVEGEAGARAMLAGLSRDRGELEQAEVLFTESLRRFREADEPWGEAQAITGLASLAVALGRNDEALVLADEAFRRHTALGNLRGVGLALRVQAEVALASGELEQAEELCEASLHRARRHGTPRDVIATLRCGGEIALHAGHLEVAALRAEEAVQPYRATGSSRGAAPALALLAVVRARQGQVEVARALGEEGLDLAGVSKDQRASARCLSALAEAALGAGDAEQAARLLSAARIARSFAGAPLAPVEQADDDALRLAVERALGDTPFARLWVAEWETTVLDLRDGRPADSPAREM